MMPINHILNSPSINMAAVMPTRISTIGHSEQTTIGMTTSCAPLPSQTTA
ncbi:Uncharacterised protein [Dorea longicatena]|nr:Uncharacterised protein [Dorea longicatena]